MIYDIRPEYQTADSDSAREVEQLCADLEAALRDNEKLRDVLIEMRNANTLGAKMLARQTDLARQAEIDLASAQADNEKLREALWYYSHPDTYYGIAFVPDWRGSEFGDFLEDREYVNGALVPGKLARETLKTLKEGK